MFMEQNSRGRGHNNFSQVVYFKIVSSLLLPLAITEIKINVKNNCFEKRELIVCEIEIRLFIKIFSLSCVNTYISYTSKVKSVIRS